MKTATVLILAILSQAAGNTLLSQAMRQIGFLNHSWSATVLLALADPRIWLGIALLTAFFLLYAACLSWADLSFVLPTTSFGYVLNVALAHRFLGEPVSASRWAGTLLITGGVIVVSRAGTTTIKVQKEDPVFSCAREDSE